MGGVLEAPMPGKVVKVKVKVGDKVKEGDVIAVIEAMKMEIELVAPASGIIKDLNISEGEAVKKNRRCFGCDRIRIEVFV